MATKYVKRARVSRNGQTIQHMKSYEEGEIEYASEVKLMDSDGSSDSLPRYRFKIDYAIPQAGATLDWSGVRDETWVIELQGGRRVTYTGVDCLKRSGYKTDGDNEGVITLDFIATTQTYS